jgi:hypothetical protein
VLENKVLDRKSFPKSVNVGEEFIKLHNDNLHNLIITIITLDRIENTYSKHGEELVHNFCRKARGEEIALDDNTIDLFLILLK